MNTTLTAATTTTCAACAYAQTARNHYLAYGALTVGPMAARPGTPTHNEFRRSAAEYFSLLGADNSVIGCAC